AGEILDHMAHRLKDGQRSLSVLESKLLPSDRWRLRAHVSLLLREALRQIAFRDSTDFHFDATAYLEALSGVVEHHAHFILGLPWGIDLRNLLRSSGESRDADDHPFMASYLQHALQLYLAGLFLADVQVKGRFGGGRTLLGVLASQGLEPGTGALRELRQAYALAALFHDAGMLLFPRVFFPNQELPQGDRSVRERLRHVRQEVDSAAQDLMAECERELVSEQYFDPQKERSIAGWLRVETEAGRYDHSLVGAWYLHRVACTVVPFEVLRPAVRAILLHQIVAQPISSQQDPTAALLVLCDELMDWRPSGRPKGGLAAGFPDLGSRSLDVRREGSRAQSIRFPQLTYRNDCWEMQVASGEPFPLVEITLREPDHLTMPVYQIWFLMLQNLVRVIDDSSRQWQPEVTVTSSVPGNLAARDTNHQEVLGILARTSRHPCRAFLETWLQRLTNESVGTQTSPGAIVRERFRLSAGRDEIWTESLAYALAPLAVDYENVVREIPILPKR
ncbi:MAG TPA: hypothetical protein VN851_08155, partial [Thermoanaerobaculia bacterium]|nr:hypothetical protein [Thermoanaerobaculia bacterium]